MATLAGACSSSHEATPAAAKPAVAVRTVPVAVEPLADTFEAGGTVRARTIAPLSARIVSPVLAVHVAAGDRVRKGQRLVTLDARQLDASARMAGAAVAGDRQSAAAADAEVAVASAGLARARQTFTRIETLRERKSVTPAEVDDATAALRSAEAQLEAATARRAGAREAIAAGDAGARAASVSASYSVIEAPFDGVVADVPAEPGQMASPGIPLVVVEDPGRYRLEVSVDASRGRVVKAGSRAAVSIEGFEPIEGTVAESTESVDAAGHSFVVKVDLPSAPGLRSGLFGRARFTAGESRGIAVPASAVVRRGQLTLVFVDDNAVARMRVVHAGSDDAGRVRILAGLAEGDRVIDNPPPGLLDGTPVTAPAGRVP